MPIVYGNMMKSSRTCRASRRLLLAVCLVPAVSVLAIDAPATAPSTRPVTQPATRPTTAPANLDAQVAALVPRLDGGTWKERDAAEAALVALGPDAEAALRKAVDSSTRPEVRLRVEGILAQLESQRRTGPSLVTLHVKGVPMKSAFEEVFRQCNADLAVYPPNLLDQGGSTVTVDFDRTPFWAAMKELCEKTGLNVRHVYESQRPTLIRDGGQMAPMAGPAVIAGPAILTAAGISGSLNVNFANPPAARAARSGSLSLQLLLEPWAHTTGGGIEVETLEDENGKSLLLTGDAAQRATNQPGLLQFEAPFHWNAQVPIALPDGSKRIKRFAGKLHLSLHAKTEHVSIENVLKAEPVVRTVGNYRFRFESVRGAGDNYTVQLTMFRDGLGQAEWKWFAYPYGRIRLQDAAGHDLSPSGGGGGNDGKEAQFQMTFARHNAAGVAIGEPARFAWDLPAEVRELIVPFTFTDLPLP